LHLLLNAAAECFRRVDLIHMPYGLIVLIASIALSGVYIAVTEASFWSKALVLMLLLLSFGWSYGFYLRMALGVYLSLYFTYLKARSEHG
jgi:hypothetical protein